MTPHTLLLGVTVMKAQSLDVSSLDTFAIVGIVQDEKSCAGWFRWFQEQMLTQKAQPLLL